MNGPLLEDVSCSRGAVMQPTTARAAAASQQECFLTPPDYFSSGLNSPAGQCPCFLVESKLIVLWAADFPLHPAHNKCGLSALRGREE